MLKNFRSISLRTAALAALIIGSAIPSLADLTLTSELKDGDKVSDIAKVAVKALSDDGVDKVEFRVDDMLRFTDTSTPYVYDWDTLSDMEGEHTITVTAYDANGVSKRIVIKLKVDNELGTGAMALADKALTAIADKDVDMATRYARRAQKLDAGNVAAARVLGKISAGKGEWDRAISAFDKVEKINDSPVAMRELSTYKMQRALRPDNSSFAADLGSAQELSRKAGESEIAAAVKANPDTTAPSAAAVTARGDANLIAGKFAAAAAEYAKAGDEAPNAVLARRVLALLDADKIDSALAILRPIFRAKTDDAPLRALYGIVYLRTRDFVRARDVVKKDLADQYPAALVVAAFADAGLGKRKEALAEVKDATTLNPNLGEAYYAESLANADLRESDVALRKAMALAPLQPGPVNNLAARLANAKRNDRYEQALNLTDVTLKYLPDNYFANLIQGMVYLQTKKDREADTAMGKVVKLERDAPETQMALAVYYDARNNGSEADKYLQKVRIAEPRLEKTSTPAPAVYLDLLNRTLYFRAEPFLTLESLFPSK